MNMQFEYKIGDAVYVARYEVEREIIKAIKVEGLKHRISYGFASKRDYFSFFSEDYSWKPKSEVFNNIPDAEKQLKKQKAEQIKEDLKYKKERIAEKKAQIAELKAEIESEK